MTAATQPLKPAVPEPFIEPLLEVRNLVKHFPIRGGIFSTVKEHVRAVDGVTFSLDPGKTLGLVGESGCGKTTVGRTLLRLIPATGGEVLFGGTDILQAGRSELLTLRREMQIIFQDPYGSLNPRMTIGQIVGEPLWLHARLRGKVLRQEVGALLEQVGLRSYMIDRYPHEFSGGQRQRIGIARAVALKPKFIVCDEPTSALDVSIRAQIINLLQDLQQSLGMSYLMISHDLGVVRHISNDVAVMYLGKIVEQAPTESLYRDARHPYTELLLSAIPVPNPRLRGVRRGPVIKPAEAANATTATTATAAALDKDDAVPSPINIPPGCAFHPRCLLYHAKGKPEICRTQPPELLPLADQPTHRVRCHFPEESRYTVPNS